MTSNKKYWQSVVEIDNPSIVETLSKNEFVEEIPTDEFIGDKETLKICWIHNRSCDLSRL